MSFTRMQTEKLSSVGKPTFIVIGAQKSATTSLYQWMLSHPDIYLSQQKELAFFSDDSLYSRGLPYYCSRWFNNIEKAKAIGDVSPQYMMASVSAERIAENLPDVKLIAILRNPIDRAYSHYIMSLRRGLEEREFDESVHELMSRGYSLPTKMDDTNYIAHGCYGAILKDYYKLFSSAQILVLFYEELESNPRQVIRDVFSFLGVNELFVPATIDHVFNRGAYAKRFPRFESWVLKQSWFKRIVKAFIPTDSLSKFLFWFDTEFNVDRSKSTINLDMDSSTRKELVEFYKNDVLSLERLIERKVPWPEFGGEGGPQ